MTDRFTRFMRFVPKGVGMDKCLPWQGHKTVKGYGNFRWTTKASDPKMLAHRAAWTLLRGPIPDGMSVLHRCDNRPCVNPNHLYLGTQLDNMRDCSAKGRLLSGPRKNEKCEKGHPIKETEKGVRYCVACRKESDRQRWRKNHPHQLMLVLRNPLLNPPTVEGAFGTFACTALAVGCIFVRA